MIDPQVIIDKLNCLTPEDLYKLMKEEGITGIKQAAGYCVIANYLKKHEVVTDAQIFGVCPVGIVVRNINYEVGPNLARFILRFDHGDYPDLSVGDMAALDRFAIEGEMKLIEEALW